MKKDLSLFDLLNIITRNRIFFISIVIISLICGYFYSNQNKTIYAGTLKVQSNKNIEDDLFIINSTLANSIKSFETVESINIFSSYLNNLINPNFLADVLEKNSDVKFSSRDEIESFISSSILIEYEIASLIDDSMREIVPPSFKISIYSQKKSEIKSLLETIIISNNENIKNKYRSLFYAKSDIILEEIKMKNDSNSENYLWNIENIKARLSEDVALSEYTTKDQFINLDNNINVTIEADNQTQSDLEPIIDMLQNKFASSPFLDEKFLKKKLQILDGRDMNRFVNLKNDTSYFFNEQNFLESLQNSFLMDNSSEIVLYNLNGINYEIYNKFINIMLVAFLSGFIIAIVFTFLLELFRNEYISEN